MVERLTALHRSAGNDGETKVGGQPEHLAVVHDVQAAVQGAESKLGGPVQFHLRNQVRAETTDWFQIVVGGMGPNQGVDLAILEHNSDILPVADVHRLVNRDGEALRKRELGIGGLSSISAIGLVARHAPGQEKVVKEIVKI